MERMLLLLDLNNLAKRAFHGGVDPLAVIGGIIHRHGPSHMVCVRDPHGPTWHHTSPATPPTLTFVLRVALRMVWTHALAS